MNDHIYIISLPQTFGGGEIYQIRLAELMHIKQRFTVVSPSSPRLQSGILKADGCFVELSGCGGIALRIRVLKWLWLNRKMLREHAAALVLNGRGSAYFAPMVKIITGMAPVIICHTELISKGMNFKEWLFGRALHFGRQSVAVSETVAIQLAQRWPDLPISAIPNWVSSDQYVSRLVASDVDGERADIAVIGRLDENKGILDILAVCSGAELPAVHFYGEGPLHKMIKGIAVSNPGITTHGHIEELWKQLSRHAILLSASYSESFSYSVAEGIHAGLLCVVSDIPAHRELLGPAYPDTLYFSPGDKRGLRTALATARDYFMRDDSTVSDIIGLAKERICHRNGPEQARKNYRAVLLGTS